MPAEVASESSPQQVKPKDAATLVIIRDQREVLMGIRHSNHVFMPNKYVFPGGRMDQVDHIAYRPIGLQQSVQSKLQARADASLAEPLAMAAIRETFEETGLALGIPESVEPVQAAAAGESWSRFFGLGLVPALNRLSFAARAITPPGGPRRFDSRFFVTDAEHMQGEVCGNGELLDLEWVALADCFDLDLPHITRYVLQLLQSRIGKSGRIKPEKSPVPLIHWVGDEVVVEDL